MSNCTKHKFCLNTHLLHQYNFIFNPYSYKFQKLIFIPILIFSPSLTLPVIANGLVNKWIY